MKFYVHHDKQNLLFCQTQSVICMRSGLKSLEWWDHLLHYFSKLKCLHWLVKRHECDLHSASTCWEAYDYVQVLLATAHWSPFTTNIHLMYCYNRIMTGTCCSGHAKQIVIENLTTFYHLWGRSSDGRALA